MGRSVEDRTLLVGVEKEYRLKFENSADLDRDEDKYIVEITLESEGLITTVVVGQ